MKLLVLTAMWPDDTVATYGVVVAREVDAWRVAGHDVDVVTKPRGYRGYPVALRELRRRLASGRYDALHVHYGTMAALLLVAGRLPRTVLTLHGSELTTGWRPTRSRYFIQWWLTAIGGLRASTVIVQAEFMRRMLPPWLRRRAVVLPQPVDVERFRRDDRPLRDDTVRDDSVLFLARRQVPVKRFDLARKAARIAGADDRLRSLDEFPPELLPRAMATARVGLLTSAREGAPVALKEAVAAGLPVVAVDLPGVREVAERVPGAVDLVSEDPHDIAAALQRRLGGPRPAADAASWLAAFTAHGWTTDAHRTALTRLLEPSR
jgi:teichuronic acid biosynthesis glycosyltransferase TuaC